MQHTEPVSGDLLYLCDVLAGRKTLRDLKKRGSGRLRRLLNGPGSESMHPAVRKEIEMLRAFASGAEGGRGYFVVAAEYRIDDCATVHHLRREGDALLYHEGSGTLLVVECKKMWGRGWEDEKRMERGCEQSAACARRLRSWFRHLAEIDADRMGSLARLPMECCVLTWEREEELVLSKIAITKGFVPGTFRFGDGIEIKEKIDYKREGCREEERLPVGCQSDNKVD